MTEFGVFLQVHFNVLSAIHTPNDTVRIYSARSNGNDYSAVVGIKRETFVDPKRPQMTVSVGNTRGSQLKKFLNILQNERKIPGKFRRF